MNFAPKSPAELQAERQERLKLLATGPADFVVKSATDSASSSDGTEQIELHVEVTDAPGNTKVIKDWLTPKMMEKVRNFCYAAGIGTLYEQGLLAAEHCEGLAGRCMVAIEKGKPDGKGGMYPDKNKIRDYIPGAATPSPARASVAVPDATPAMRKAQSAFKAKTPPETPHDEMVEAWNQAVRKYFFGKDPGLVTTAEWAKFQADGFKKPAPAQPFGDEQQFKEDDIPF